jgi:hypothetical protein
MENNNKEQDFSQSKASRALLAIQDLDLEEVGAKNTVTVMGTQAGGVNGSCEPQVATIPSFWAVSSRQRPDLTGEGET